MNKIFLGIYRFFCQHKILFYSFLILSVVAMGISASKIRLRQTVADFFPSKTDLDATSDVFQNLEITDKIMVMLTPVDGTASADSLMQVADELATAIQESCADYLKGILLKIDDETISDVSDFIYSKLPFFLTDSDYVRIDTMLNSGSIARRMRQNYQNLISPIGMGSKRFIMRDPLGLGFQTLENLQDFQIESGYIRHNNYLFTKDTCTLLMVLMPKFDMGQIGDNQNFVTALENEIQQNNNRHKSIKTEYFGGVSVSVYNARQVMNDTLVTSILALIIIVVFISLVFKRKSSIPLILAPVVYGALFALALISVIKGEITIVAIGAGAAVIGIALSYSIHMLAHQNHVTNVEQLISELAYPLTIGSFTTIGAFFALVFTNSGMLRDFGLFASLTLIGTTLFCLIFLPHFLKGQANVKQGRMLRLIEKINTYSYEKNKWLVGAILVAIVVGFFTAGKVRFNSDMMTMYYEPEHLKEARERLESFADSGDKNVMFVSVGDNIGKASSNYAETNLMLDSLKNRGLIKGYASAQRFVIPADEQQRRLDLWNGFWTDERRQLVESQIAAETEKYHFKASAFNGFFDWFNSSFEPIDYSADNSFSQLLSNWTSTSDKYNMLITQVLVNNATKEQVYSELQDRPNLVIYDRSYYTNQWVSTMNDDFNWILYVSSFLVFGALLVSFGRIELTLISFLPMFVSWFVILGFMAIFGIEFNIINIILSTFIFGIGDDFSIFIMDGLQNRYRTGQKILDSHKTAIFCSAFTIIVGMGALAFAQHPSLQSISLISIVGILVVVLVAFAIEPIIFNFFIANPASKGNLPYTAWGLLRTAFSFGVFLAGCIALRLLSLVLCLVPVKKRIKRDILCFLMSKTCRMVIMSAPQIRYEVRNREVADFGKPSVIIANHQSFMDILVMLSLSRKVLMVTNKWVWYSPFFGGLIRYVGFFYNGNPYESNLKLMSERVKEGYSIMVFPEGTRSVDGTIGRFHKGAFCLSEELKIDITPVVLYGAGNIIAKKQPFNVRRGRLLVKILPRIKFTDRSFGDDYRARTKVVSALFKHKYSELCDEFDHPDNMTFYDMMMHNYIYKGPVEEWYLRVKIKMEHCYELFDKLVPRQGQITDIGCGYGPLCYMLALTSKNRNVLGIDYDEDKIALAQHGWLRGKCNLNFAYANALEYNLPQSDVFILNDMLHYMSAEHQNVLIHKCVDALAPDGFIIIRDGNSEEEERHKVTKFTEVMSTKIIKFNKTEEQLCFMSESRVRAIASECGMSVESIQNDKYTSNTIYIFRKKANENA